MARHHSSVIIELPDRGDAPVLKIHFECDTCAPSVWTCDIVHLGSLMRALVAAYEKHGGDDGVHEAVGGAVSGAELESLKARIRSAQRAFKARQP